jgi:hypothetical protein
VLEQHADHAPVDLVQQFDDGRAVERLGEAGEVAKVAEEDRDLAALAGRAAVAAALDRGRHLRREIAPETLAAALLLRDAVDEIDGARGHVEARDGDAPHDERDGEDERRIGARHHEQRAFEHGADDGGEDDAPPVEREGGGHGEERKVGDAENGRRHVEVVAEDGKLEGEGRRHVEQRHVDTDEPRDPVRAADAHVERGGGEPIRGEQQDVALIARRRRPERRQEEVERECDRDADEADRGDDAARAQPFGVER